MIRNASLGGEIVQQEVVLFVGLVQRRAEPYRFELSAVMKTAAGGPAREDHQRARTESDALRQAVRTLTQDYEDAVRNGEMPDDRWLVPVGG